MTPRWERIAETSRQTPVLMDAVLAPNRSLSISAKRLLLVVFAIANLVPAVVFLMHGAYPVSGFMGLDVVALIWAFHVNNRAGLARERVQVSPASVQVTRRRPNAQESHWAASPLWARVQDHPSAVRISAGGKDVLVGGFLAPVEREEFAEALKAALVKARAQRPNIQSPSTSAIE